jgi:hypothetical protein
MGLQNNSKQRITFVNLTRGRLYTKEKEKEPVYYTEISAYITKVDFRIDELNGKKFEVAEFNMLEDGEKYVLKLRTDSGYFRGLVNSLKSGNTKDKFTIIPNYKEEEGKTKTTCFVKQNGQTLKHAHTLANPGDLPPAEKVSFKGQEMWDSSNQLSYWKKFLTNATWYNEENIQEEEILLPPDEFIDDDLPF